MASKGRRVPELESRPLLFPGLRQVWLAFDELHGTRGYTFGPQPIQLSEIASWLDLQGIFDPDTRREYSLYVMAMDSTYLTWYAETKGKPTS